MSHMPAVLKYHENTFNAGNTHDTVRGHTLTVKHFSSGRDEGLRVPGPPYISAEALVTRHAELQNGNHVISVVACTPTNYFSIISHFKCINDLEYQEV